MKKIISALMVIIFVSGCALTTIRPPKKHGVKKSRSVKKAFVQKAAKISKPRPKPIAPKKEKEEVLPIK